MDPTVALIALVEAFAFLAVALFYSSKRLSEKALPRIAVLAAGIFVAQMLNFPIGGGTTGHLVGGALMAILVGPALAMVGMTVVLTIQALLFGDGGITAFGLNTLNMAVIAPLIGWGVYTLLQPLLSWSGRARNELAAGVAAWASVFVSAAACAAELSVSHAISGGSYGIAAVVAIPSMLSYHAVIGVGEGIITAGVIAYLARVSEDAFMVAKEPTSGQHWLRSILASRTAQATLAVMVVFAAFLPLYFLYSSQGEDGLESTMTDAGYGGSEPLLTSPLDYGENYFAALFAGIAGFVSVALASLGVLRVVTARKAETDR